MGDLKKICGSSLNLKIISFFHQHPATVDTAVGYAAWLNQDRDKVAKALDFLANQKVLVVHRTRATLAYGFTQNKAMIKRIEKLLKDKT